MKRAYWVRGLWLGLMNVSLILIVVWYGSNPRASLIHTDPRNFLITAEDLTAETTCSFGAALKQLLTNDAIIYLLGDAAGQKRIRETGRLTGWRYTFSDAECRSDGPDEVNLSVMQFATSQGAQLNLERYALSSEQPQRWKRLDTRLDLGEKALAEMRITSSQAGSQRITYALSFTYRNIGARVEVSGAQGAVSLEQARSLAEEMLERLAAAELCKGPVPTPTVGFELDDLDSPIYR